MLSMLLLFGVEKMTTSSPMHAQNQPQWLASQLLPLPLMPETPTLCSIQIVDNSALDRLSARSVILLPAARMLIYAASVSELIMVCPSVPSKLRPVPDPHKLSCHSFQPRLRWHYVNMVFFQIEITYSIAYLMALTLVSDIGIRTTPSQTIILQEPHILQPCPQFHFIIYSG